MKNILFAALISAPLFFAVNAQMSQEEAESKLAQAEARVAAAEKKVQDLAAKIDEASQKASSYAGKHEAREHITGANNNCARLQKEHDRARVAVSKAHDQFHAAKSEIVADNYPVTQAGDKWVVGKPHTKGDDIRSEQPTAGFARRMASREYRAAAAA